MDMAMAELAKTINYMGATAGGAGNMVSLAPEELIVLAKRNTGLSDFGCESWLEAYRELLRYLDADESLHTIGRLITRSTALRVLSNRLMITHEISKNPRILSEKIASPLFVTGNPRSGTSILLELLAQSKKLRYPATWEAICPVGPPAGLGVADEEEFRVEITKASNDIFMDIYPAFRAVRELRWDLPVECFQIMDLAFSQLLNGKNDDYRWMEKMDKESMYGWNKKVLQLLQFGGHGMVRSWLLKCPLHIHFLPQLFSEFPDARVIYIHRSPMKSMPSLLSFHRYAISSIATYHMPKPMEEVKNWARGSLRALEQRKSGVIPNDRIVDIRYSDLMESPVDTIKYALGRVGGEFDDQLAAGIIEYLQQKPRHKYGGHEYSLESFGVSRSEVVAHFKDYIEAYDVHDEV